MSVSITIGCRGDAFCFFFQNHIFILQLYDKVIHKNKNFLNYSLFAPKNSDPDDGIGIYLYWLL